MRHASDPGVGLLIHKLKHGLETLPLLGRASPSQMHTLVAGILGAGIGAAGLLMALRGGSLRNLLAAWASEARSDSEAAISVAGLQNLGNNCFLNVVLQTLASCSCFSSYLQNVLNTVDSELKGMTEEMPLTFALVSLLKDLSIIRERRIVLSPRKVMLAMDLYTTSFNLSSQQDAAEAFLHLMASLEEEILEHYIPHSGSLADIFTLSGKFSCMVDERPNEYRRWKQQFLGPFDGSIGSMLYCASCSRQLSIDFDIFRCLPISPVLDNNTSIMDGCTVADCLRQFTAVEQLQNYRCASCWHVTALRYLSLKAEENMEKIKTINDCLQLDSCDCKSLFHHEMTWSSGSSHAFKQLCISRFPKILCLHLQRASMNIYGELIKLEGHISFPLLLDPFQFTATAKEVACKHGKEGLPQVSQLQQEVPTHLSSFNMPLKTQMVRYTSAVIGDNAQFQGLSGNVSRFSTNDYNQDSVIGRAHSSDISNSESLSMPEDTQHKGNDFASSSSIDSNSFMYRLVSVVEHYGKSGSGHYAVYRRLRADSHDMESVVHFDNLGQRWVYVSDGHVSSVPLDMVLSAEASLLFYEAVESSM